MNYSLKTITLQTTSKEKLESAVIFCHVYGGDGKDISLLANYWKNYLPNTIFLCPDAPEVCKVNPSGFQWFDLSKDDSDYILQESLKAEKKLLNYINEVKDVFKLESKRICISGFSQGCMLSINVGLTSHENLACIVGFSGKIINKDNLLKRKKSNTNFLLIHGELDEVVDPSNLLEAKDFLMRHNIDVQTHIIAACGHNIPVEASSLALAFIKENFNRL